jgi:hypothetical protein
MLDGPLAHRINEAPFGGSFVFTESDGTQRQFCGLLDVLKDACFSNYDYTTAKSLAGTPPALKRATGLRMPWQGLQRGRMVHHQIRACVNAGGVGTMRALSSNTRTTNAKSVTIAEHFLRSLATLHLTPVRAEFVLCYEALSLASAIDLLCIHTHPQTGRKTLSIIEVKTGYENSFTDGTGALLAPPSLSTLFNNSPRTQAMLQLGFYRQMVRHNFPAVEIGPCYVAQVRKVDTVYHALPQTIIQAMPDVLAHVSAHRFQQLQGARKRRRSSSGPRSRR